jgi:hypothetical protein
MEVLLKKFLLKAFLKSSLTRGTSASTDGKLVPIIGKLLIVAIIILSSNNHGLI